MTISPPGTARPAADHEWGDVVLDPSLLTGSRLTPDLLADLASGIRTRPGAGISTTVAPFTGRPWAQVPMSTLEDVEDAFTEARTAQKAWAARPAKERARILRRTHDLVLDNQDLLADLNQVETGKARYDAVAEAIGVAIAAGYYGRVGPHLLKPERRRGLVPVATAAWEAHRPKGVIGFSAAWNFPAVFAGYDGLPALMAGNALVYRPDSQAPLTALMVRHLAVQAGLPPELWQVVLGPGSKIGMAVVDRADHMVFTGSTRVGRIVAGRAAERLISVSLELGGKNPLIVLADADLKRAAAGAVRATYTNGGQACVGTERLLVDRRVAEEFTALLVKEIESVRLGTGLNFGFDLGPLTNKGQLETALAHIEDAVAKGATVLAGGRARPDIAPFAIEPTLLGGVTDEMRCRHEETFGPVLSLVPFDSVDEAIESANATEFGLAAAVWTKDVKHGLRLAERLEAGTVDINESYFATWGSIDVPQGGMGESGVGRRNGRVGLLRFTEAQGIAAQRLHGIHPPRGMEHEQFAKVLTLSLRAMAKLRIR